MARRTKEDAQQTRLTIMDAAIELFYEHGVSQTSLQKIAQRAGVTRGAVYWHFRDKVDILKAIADDHFLPNEELLENLSLKDLDNPINDIRRLTKERMDDLTHDPVRRQVFTILTQRCEYIEEMKALADRNEACRLRIKEKLIRIFHQAKRKGQLAKQWTPETAAFVLQHFIFGIVDIEMEYPEFSQDRDADRHAAMDSFYDALIA